MFHQPAFHCHSGVGFARKSFDAELVKGNLIPLQAFLLVLFIGQKTLPVLFFGLEKNPSLGYSSIGTREYGIGISTVPATDQIRI